MATLGSTGAATHHDQIKSRERVRDLGEVYTHANEVNAMLDLIPDAFPTSINDASLDKKFFEPACGTGNFLAEILRRKLAHATGHFNVLRACASIHAIDISDENVDESRARLRAIAMEHAVEHMPGFESALDAILETNIIHADTLADADKITLVDYAVHSNGHFQRTWETLRPVGLMGGLETRADARPVAFHEMTGRHAKEPVT